MENIQQELDAAISLINKEEFVEAKSKLEQIIKVDPENIEAYKNLGLCEVNLDNPVGAIKAFKKVTLLDTKDATSLFYLANCYNKTGQKEFAIDNFRKVINLRLNYLDAYKSLGMIYIEFTNYDAAISVMSEAINNEEIEKDYSIFYIMATAYLLKKDNLNAIKYLEEALKLNPSHIQIANSLAVSYMNNGMIEKALPVLEKIYALDDKNPLTCYNFGVYYQTTGDFKSALEYFQKAYELEPTASMLSSLANCALKAKEGETADLLYKNLVNAYPNNVMYRLSYIEALELVENYEEALKNIENLLQNDEKNISYIKKKGAYLRKLGKFEQSIETFSALIKRGKIDIEVYYNLAINYVLTFDNDNAKEMFKKCIALEPNNPYAHKDLGVLYLKMNCYDWALDEIKKAIELEDDVAEFHYSLGVCYMMLSRIDEAKTSLENALKYEPNNPDCLAYYAYIFMLNRDYEKAYPLLQKAIQIDSNNFLAKSHLAKYYFALNKFDVAKELLLDIVSSSKDDEMMNMLAICYMKTDDFESAAGLFTKLLPAYPDNHILFTNLARCEMKINKINEAKEHLRKALMIFNDYDEALELLEELKADGKQ